MQSRFVQIVCAVAALGLCPARAAMITLTPNPVAVTPGGTVTLDVDISGLGMGIAPKLGAFDLTVAFDPSLLTPVGVTFGPFLGDPSLFEALTAVAFPAPSLVNLAEISLLSPSDLYTLQPDSFTLASIDFLGTGSGSASFYFTGLLRLDDEFGNKIVPEPGTWWLLMCGAAFVLAGRTKWLRR